jgi:hypothetical protein
VLLTTSTHGRLRVLGVNPCAGVHCTWIPDGDCQGNLSLGQHTGDWKSDGKTFLGRTWMFLLISGGFTAACLHTITKGVLDPRCPGKCTCVLQVSTTRRPVPHIRTVKGQLHLVPSRTPRSSGYDVYAHVVYVVICNMSVICICLLYVVICYMSFICYMSVICLVLGGVVRVRLYDM